MHSRDLGYAPFWLFNNKNLRDHVRTVPENVHVKFKLIALTVLVLLAFNWSD